MRRMPIGSVGGAGIDGVLAELPVVVLAVSEETTLGLGVASKIGATTLEAAAVAAVAATTTTARWLAKSIVLAARDRVSNRVISPRK